MDDGEGRNRTHVCETSQAVTAVIGPIVRYNPAALDANFVDTPSALIITEQVFKKAAQARNPTFF
eukprot:scaffold25851_cov122-Cylindrotheca_fusiformis.AAC.2